MTQSPRADPLRSAVAISLMLQVALSALAVGTLDGGRLATAFACVLMVYWFHVAVMLVRGRGKRSPMDLGTIRYGPLVAFVMACALANVF